MEIGGILWASLFEEAEGLVMASHRRELERLGSGSGLDTKLEILQRGFEIFRAQLAL